MKPSERILITGAGGQLGQELTTKLIQLFGGINVFATDISEASKTQFESCHFQQLDVMDKAALELIIHREKITQVYHLAAILSANGESNPLFTWDLNTNSLLSVLELSRIYKFKIFWRNQKF